MTKATFSVGRSIFSKARNNIHFTQRGAEITRIEALSDAVFAFSISLLIMSLEVPQTFKELIFILHSFLPFVATVSLIFLFWYQQYRFFRNYGLNDVKTIVLNAALLVLVLFYVYPLKFLFALLLNMWTGLNFFPKATAHNEVVLTQQDFPALVMIYSAGYAAIWLTIFLMYRHAARLRYALSLTMHEMEGTNKQLRGSLLNTIIGIASFCFAWGNLPSIGGLCFLLIAPLLWFNNVYTNKRQKKIKSR